MADCFADLRLAPIQSLVKRFLEFGCEFLFV